MHEFLGNTLGMIDRIKTDRKAKKQLRPRVKLWVEYGGQHVFCSGMCQILQAVEHTGSIKEAAAEVGKSYRYVWAKIKRAEAALGEKLVDAQVGGSGTKRSSLSPLGKQLVSSFVSLRNELRQVTDSHFSGRFERP